MTNILTSILNEDLLNEWYKDRHGNIRPEYEDVEDDLRDGKHLPDIKKTTTVSKALAAGRKYRDRLQKEKQKEAAKYSDVKHYRDLPKEENDGVYPSSKNDWHNKIMTARKAGKSIDAHENRAIIKNVFEQRLLHNEINTHQNGNEIVKTKMVKLKHTNPGQETEVHVFKSGLHVPVKERNGQKSYDLTAAYRLRHPSEKLITPSPKKDGV